MAIDKAMAEERSYLDYAATAPMRPEVLEAMLPYMQAASGFGNANTLYAEGKQAAHAVEKARSQIARAIGATPPEIVFTSGGTESDNAATYGITQGIYDKFGAAGNSTGSGADSYKGHVICSAFEHDAVLEPVQTLKRLGYEVTLLAPNRDGFVEPDALESAMRADTVLVSIMAANNEIGTVQPIAELTRVAHDHGALFHTDAVQALGKIAFDVRALDVDAASFSAHKIGGPMGVGALYLKRGVPFAQQQRGGGQEGKRRSGTLDVCGIVGFGEAAKLACESDALSEKASMLVQLRDDAAKRLTALSKRVSLTVPIPARDVQNHLPGMLNILVSGIESQTMVLRLDEAGVATSGGSACSTGSLDPSHVLTAIGISDDAAFGALRVSMGWNTTKQDVDKFVDAFTKCIIMY
ncbi:MAG: cysteine desulfurase [Coriobacteriales bacterium]|jgi:cysteine desulfurase|nr:cysteine desulfurase [Coriobacteriales bacterium]